MTSGLEADRPRLGCRVPSCRGITGATLARGISVDSPQPADQTITTEAAIHPTRLINRRTNHLVPFRSIPLPFFAGAPRNRATGPVAGDVDRNDRHLWILPERASRSSLTTSRRDRWGEKGDLAI